MAAAAKSSLCRGPRDNREDVDEEEETPDAPSPDAEIPELQHLYSALVAPIKDQLDPTKDTIFVPHGVLSLVPFTALRDPSGTPLVASHPVSTAPSARVLRTMLARGNGLETDATLVVGNPVTLPQYELQAIPGAEEEASQV